jgi:radical SAM superfamily enzyme YgiQ (UPF0313 family)
MDYLTLISPPSLFLNEPKAYPPLGLLYLASAIRKANPDVKIEVLDFAKHRRLPHITEPDLVGITCTTPHIPKVNKIIENVDESIPVLLGGPHPTVMPWTTLKEMDVWGIVKGYGERRLPLIINNFDNLKVSLKKFFMSDHFEDVHRWSLNSVVPMPAWDLIDLHEYNPEIEGNKAMTIYSSRGCPYNCAFCTSETFCKRRVWFHSPKRVFEEIATLRDDYDFENFIFGDDNFLLNKRRLIEICDMIKPLGINYRCIGRVDNVDDEILDSLEASGCTELSFGVESGSNKILERMNKGFTADKSEEVVKHCKDRGFIVKTFFISGFPGENDSTVDETCDWFDRVMPDKWLLSQFVPYPGTQVFLDHETFGITEIDRDLGKYYTAGIGGRAPIVYETVDCDRDKLRELHDRTYEHMQSMVEMDR